MCRDSAYSIRTGKVTELQREPQKILKIRTPGDVKANIKVDIKVKQFNDIKNSKIEY